MSTLSIAPLAPARTERPAGAVRVAARPAARPGTQVRLTRRGRAVVFLLACAVVAAVAVLWAAGSAATDAAPARGGVSVITVAPGETLWAIAGDVAPELGIDRDEARTRIKQMNDLDGGMLYAGQQLRIPSAG